MKRNKRKVSNKGPVQKPTVSEADAQLELEQGRSKITLPEYFAAPVVALLAAIWVFGYLGTSIEWDDLFYMNVSQYTTKEAWVLNRYGHIYLQKFFFWLTGDALTGTKVYWSFLFFSTCVLVYWCARFLAGKGGWLIGILAVLLLSSNELFAYYAGCTFSDFTVMFLVTLATFIYLYIGLRTKSHRNAVLIILGLIFFWATKSKESGICLIVLLIGILMRPESGSGARHFWRDIGWICIGALGGFIILMILDAIFLKDPIFSIRPSNIEKLLKFNYRGAYHRNVDRSMSWYTYISTKPFFACLLLYFLTGCGVSKRKFSTQEKIAWVLPIILVMFISYVRGCFHVIWRYFTPAIPGMCIWASQFFNFNIRGYLAEKSGNRGIPRLAIEFALVLAALIIVCLYMAFSVDNLIDYFQLKGQDIFYAVAILPISVTILVIVGGLSKKRGLIALFVSFVCFFFIIYHPLKANLTYLKQKVVAKKSEWRYEPYRIFADELRFDKDVKILVSKDIYKSSGMLGREVRAHCWMFNIFFNQKFTYDQFIDGSHEDILKGNYTYAFLTFRDWEYIRKEHSVDHLLRDYIPKADKATQILLLKRR